MSPMNNSISKRKRTKVRNVLIAINITGASGRDCLSGILQQIQSGMQWQIHLLNDIDSIIETLKNAKEMTLDGIITEKPSLKQSADYLNSLGIPIVFTDYHDGSAELGENCSLVQLDDVAIGAEAVRFLCNLGHFNSWVFATTAAKSKFSKLREIGFREALHKKEISPTILSMDPVQNAFFAGDINCRLLSELPKPIAVFAAWDHSAVAALTICKKVGVKVPDQAVILGVDNDEILCLGTSPSLTSILPDHINLGKNAVLELDKIMNGRKTRKLILKRSVREIISRNSTCPTKPAEHLIRNALNFIANHSEEDISVNDVARHLRVSRALADRRFRELYGQSIRKVIAKTRIAAIKKRLKSSRSRIEDIAHACGFANAAALSRYFHRETGQTPSSYRKDDAENQ